MISIISAPSHLKSCRNFHNLHRIFLQSARNENRLKNSFVSLSATSSQFNTAVGATDLNGTPNRNLNTNANTAHILKKMNPKTKRLAKSILGDFQQDQSHFNHNMKHDSTGNIGINIAKPKGNIQRRTALSRAITLTESRSPVHHEQANLLLNYLMAQMMSSTEHPSSDSSSNRTPKSTFRVGIAGPPGAGKSTLIEALGLHALQSLSSSHNHPDSADTNHINLVVLCIDPSSSITGGSILGDKTRMMELSRHPNAFVRPSPTGGHLGGLTTSTTDTIQLCTMAMMMNPLSVNTTDTDTDTDTDSSCEEEENNNTTSPQNSDYIIVETVGLGQNEIEIEQAVDMTILILPPGPGSGDELQGIKKGIVEMADLIIVNKADGGFEDKAKLTKLDYESALHSRPYFYSDDDDTNKQQRPSPSILLASARTGKGIPEIWDYIQNFQTQISTKIDPASDRPTILQQKRTQQSRYWMWKYMQQHILNHLQSDPTCKELFEETMKQDSHSTMESQYDHLVGNLPRVKSQQIWNALFTAKSQNTSDNISNIDNRKQKQKSPNGEAKSELGEQLMEVTF